MQNLNQHCPQNNQRHNISWENRAWLKYAVNIINLLFCLEMGLKVELIHYGGGDNMSGFKEKGIFFWMQNDEMYTANLSLKE